MHRNTQHMLQVSHAQLALLTLRKQLSHLDDILDSSAVEIVFSQLIVVLIVQNGSSEECLPNRGSSGLVEWIVVEGQMDS